MDLITADRLDEYHTKCVKKMIDKMYSGISLTSVDMITGEVVYTTDNGDETTTTTTKYMLFE